MGTEKQAAQKPHGTGIRDSAAGCTRSTGGSDTKCGLDASIDYLRVTFRPADDALDTAKWMFGGGATWRTRRSGWNYTDSLVCGDITLYHGGNGGGVTVEARGMGCRQMERQHRIEGEAGWQGFLRELSASGATFARIDFAFDERQGILSIPDMEENVRSGCCASRFRKARATDWITVSTGATAGTELVFGKRSSEIVVRMYDKGAQLGTETIHTDNVRESWVRVEIEAKDNKADDFAAEFLKGGFPAILADLRARITFRDPMGSRDRNKSRWPVCAWWEEFLGAVPRVLIVSPPASATLEDKARQIERQWGPTLVAIATAPHMGDRWFDDAVARNQTRLRNEDIDLIAASCLQHQERQRMVAAVGG